RITPGDKLALLVPEARLAPGKGGMGALANARGGAPGRWGVRTARAPDQPQRQPPRAAMTPPRLLVGGANPAVRDAWCACRSLLRYEVTSAEDGREAFARFDAAPYDLVLTDLGMAGMDGWQLAEAIRSRAATPIVVISGSGSPEDVARAQAEGMTLL